MTRLPNPGSDSGTWGGILNDFLSQVHAIDGSLKDGVVTQGSLSPGVNALLDGKATRNHTHEISDLHTTAGVASSSTYLRGDGVWATPSPVSHTLGVDDLPAGVVLFARYDTQTHSWPSRPTTRTDIMVHWIGADEANAPPEAVNGVDLWDWIGN